MFNEYQDRIDELRTSDKNLDRLCARHQALAAEVDALVARKSPSLQLEIEKLKKQKLAVKEEIYAIVRNAEPMLALKHQQNYMNQATLAQMSGMRLRA